MPAGAPFCTLSVGSLLKAISFASLFASLAVKRVAELHRPWLSLRIPTVPGSKILATSLSSEHRGRQAPEGPVDWSQLQPAAGCWHIRIWRFGDLNLTRERHRLPCCKEVLSQNPEKMEKRKLLLQHQVQNRAWHVFVL